MERGDVYLTWIRLPARDGPSGAREVNKYVIVLNPHYEHSDVGVLICDRDRNPGRDPQYFETLFPASVDGFPMPTKVDCRWVYTIEKADLEADNYKFTLTDAQMADVSDALYAGLRLD